MRKIDWTLRPALLVKGALLSLLLFAAFAVTAAAQKPNVIPNLQSWTDAAGGGVFVLNGSSRIVSLDPTLDETAALLRDELRELNRLQLAVVAGGTPQAGDIVLGLAAGGAAIGPEGYTLTIGTTVDIRGDDVRGVFYGTRTVLQTLKQDGEQRAALPKGTATDVPAYKERALMLDTARKFFTLDFLKEYVKQMAWLKLNVLHLHFTDDQGFRLESSVPGLTSPQHYTKNEMIELVAFAKKYQITIIPEIDFPAHTKAITNVRTDLRHSCPNLRDTGDLDLTNPNTVPFVKALIDEYLPIFDADSFHIGADEYTYFTKSRQYQLDSLQACPEIMTEAAARGYSDPGDLYREFINEINDYIKSKGKKTRIWEWFDYVGSMPVDNDIIYDAWLGENGIQSKSDAGFDLINSSYHYLYIIPGRSVPDKKHLYETWEPWIWSSAADGRLTNPNDPHLLGAKLHVWCDGLYTPFVPESAIDKEISTTLKVFAERIWGSPKRASYAAFLSDADRIGNVPGYGFGLIGDYKLGDAASGKAADASGFGRNGTIYGPVAAAGRSGTGTGALSFQGGSDRIHIGQPDVEGEWTASFWVNRQASGAVAAKLLDSPVSSLRLEQVNAGGKVGVTKYGTGDYAFNYTAPVGQWVHLTFVGSGAGTSLYVNGTLQDTIGQSVPMPMTTIGASQRSFKGTLDEAKLFDRALDATAVRSLYEGLVLHYSLEETDPVAVLDGSGLSNDAGFKGPVRAGGKVGQGLEFGGGDDFVYTSMPDIADEWTAAVWVRRVGSSQSAEVLMSSPEASLRVKQILSGKVGFTRNGINDYSFQYALPADGNWKHLTFVGNAQGTSLYVDGTFSETHPVRIKLPLQAVGKTTSSFKGTVDELRVYDRALGAAEIAQLYASYPINLAAGKTVTAATYEAGHGPELAVDADASNASYWDAALEDQPGRWLTVDLGSLSAIEGVKIRQFVDGTRYYHYTIEGSADGVSWTPIAAKTTDEPATDAGDYYAAALQARYVRVTVTFNSANNSVHVSDLQVYGRGV
ncbi:family 20 glycosylhydrolase [Paenibacillus flagellatus]|uniref:F5/8 type C domain-containing protein n=1 Tax=Paenibacillus flagellatus TaxID=2211139 RepID=A0A2V5KVB2_9BACL|nr:family 20 glycosylhydrolase [Paenibacillus flagellatus]PYI53446.1 hypothetical protein DLM86_16870 [Paenibacillus flagellatus]